MAKITSQQCDSMFSGIINFAHGIEKFARVVEEYYISEVRKQVYDIKVREFFTSNLIKGMSRTMAYSTAQREADETVVRCTKDELMEKSPVPYQKFISKIQELKDIADEFTEIGMTESQPKKSEDITNIYDYMMCDADIMCRLFCRFQNIDGKDDKAERAVNRYETKEIFDEEFMDKWFRTQGIEPEKPKRKRKLKFEN